MKVNIFFLVLLFCSFLNQFAFSQKTLTLTKVSDENRVIEIKERNRVTVRYMDSTKRRRFTSLFYLGKKLHYVQGKVLAINDSIITIKNSGFGPGIVEVPINKIAMIRRDRLGIRIVFGTLLVSGVLYLYYYSLPYFTFFAIPGTFVARLIFEKIIFPLKISEKRYYRNHNQWTLEVVD